MLFSVFDINALTENAVDLGEYGLQFKHFVIVENEFGKEGLLQIRNLISTLFLAETHYEYTTLRDELLNLCDTAQDVQALELFINWLRQLAHHGKIEPTDFDRMEGHAAPHSLRPGSHPHDGHHRQRST